MQFWELRKSGMPPYNLLSYHYFTVIYLLLMFLPRPLQLTLLLYTFLKATKAVSPIFTFISVNFFRHILKSDNSRCGTYERLWIFPKIMMIYAQQALVFSEAVNVLLSWMLPLSFYYPHLILLVAILFCLFSTQAKIT